MRGLSWEEDSGFVGLEEDARVVTPEAEAVAERDIDVDLQITFLMSHIHIYMCDYVSSTIARKIGLRCVSA